MLSASCRNLYITLTTHKETANINCDHQMHERGLKDFALAIPLLGNSNSQSFVRNNKQLFQGSAQVTGVKLDSKLPI